MSLRKKVGLPVVATAAAGALVVGGAAVGFAAGHGHGADAAAGIVPFAAGGAPAAGSAAGPGGASSGSVGSAPSGGGRGVSGVTSGS